MSDAVAHAPGRTVTRPVAWQGWTLALPRRWDPVQLTGTAAAGHALFADADHPRAGLRWATPRAGRRFDPAAAVRRAMAAEVGALAAAEATESFPPGEWAAALLYEEADPPGRDVWAAYSDLTGRLVTVACPVRHRRDHALARLVLPTVADAELDRAATWAVFDLAVTVPGDFALTERRLNAGDLALSFADRRGAMLMVRQIAVAELALRRQPLDRWVADQQREPLKYLYRSAGPTTDTTVGPLPGRVATLRRRRRFAAATWHPPTLVTMAAHDAARDRLLILHGTDADLLRAVAGTVGVSVTGAPESARGSSTDRPPARPA